MQKIHGFTDKLAEGKGYELELDGYFGEWFNITATDLPTDKKGIDRIFSAKHYTHLFTVQYKADVKAAETGNIFVELESVNREGVAGWAFTCPADWLIIYVPNLPLMWGGQNVFIVSARMLSVTAPLLSMEYPIKAAHNDGYESLGACVPINHFTRQPFIVGTTRGGV